MKLLNEEEKKFLWRLDQSETHNPNNIEQLAWSDGLGVLAGNDTFKNSKLVSAMTSGKSITNSFELADALNSITNSFFGNLKGILFKPGRDHSFTPKIWFQTAKNLLRHSCYAFAKYKDGNYIIIRLEYDTEVSTIKEDLNKRETVELEYDSLPITLYGGRMDWDTGCYDERDVEICWTYVVDKQDVEEFLVDKIPDDIPEDKAYDYVEEHYDELEEKYWQEILNHFEDDAIEDAQENNNEDYDTFGYDPDAEYDAWRDEQLLNNYDEDWKKMRKYTLSESLFEN